MMPRTCRSSRSSPSLTTTSSCCVQVDALFDIFDRDHSGTVDYRELAKALRRREAMAPTSAPSALTAKNTLAMQQAHATLEQPEMSRVLRGTTLTNEGDIIAQLAAALATNWARVTDLFHEVDPDTRPTSPYESRCPPDTALTCAVDHAVGH